MNGEILLQILKSAIDLHQQHSISFVLSQLISQASTAISSLDSQCINETTTLSFSALKIVEDRTSALLGTGEEETDISKVADAFDVAIHFCEEMISLLFSYQSQLSDDEEKSAICGPLNQLAKYLSSMRDQLHRKSHMRILKEMESERIQPSQYEEWEEKVDHGGITATLYPTSMVVTALNINQLPLFQAAAAALVTSSSIALDANKHDMTHSFSMESIYAQAVLPSCCLFLREGRALAAAEVLINSGRNPVSELTKIADSSFDWHIAENAICLLGEIGHLPPVDAVALFSNMAGCLAACPCEQRGFFRAFTNANGEINQSLLDPVLKYYYKKQSSEGTLEIASHSCDPIPFPFAWMQRLSAFEKRQISAACHAIKSSSTAPTPLEFLSCEDLELIVSKGEFSTFLQLIKTNPTTLFDFLIETQSRNATKRLLMPSFFINKCLNAVDLNSSMLKSSVEPLIDSLNSATVARMIACSTSPTNEHLTLRFTDDEPNRLLEDIAKLCCEKNYVFLFLSLCFNPTLKFDETVAKLPNKPVWAEFFEKSRQFLIGEGGNGLPLDEEFVAECVKFAEGHSHITEQIYAHFFRQLANKSALDNDVESPKRLAQYSGFLSSLFHDKLDVKLEDSRLLYTILRANMVFDVTKLFAFQSANYLATEEADECLNEIFGADDEFPPSFLRASISSVPSQNQQRSTPLSQLKRPEPVSFIGFGRPLRAVLQHLLHSGKQSSSGLNRQRAKIEEKVFNLAIENADNAPIVAGCILFLTVLGFSVERLQCAICVLRLLNNNQTDTSFLSRSSSTPNTPLPSSPTPSPIPYSPVTFCKLAFSRPERYSTELESICLSELASIGYDLYGSVSTLAVLDRLAGETLPSAELKPAWSRLMISLAMSNNWLGFFTYAEILQIHPDEILTLASWFSDTHLKSHIIKTARGIMAQQKEIAENPLKEKDHKQGPKRRRSQHRKANKKAPDSSDSEGEKPSTRSGRKPPNDGIRPVRRLHKTSSVIHQREQDLLNVVLQVSAVVRETKGDEDEVEFDDFIEAVYHSKNPLCAIYAACLPGANRISCLVAYFHCYYPEILNSLKSSETDIGGDQHSLVGAPPTVLLNALTVSIDHISSKRAYKTLFDGFSILMPSCPLGKLFKAAVSLANAHSLDEFKSDLKQFTLAMEFYDPQLMCPEMRVDVVSTIAGQFLARFLYIAENINLYLITILETYSDCRVGEIVNWPLRLLPVQLLGLANQLVSSPDDSADKTQPQVQPISKLLGDDVDSVNWALIADLQNRGQYIRARLVGQLLGIPLGEILMKEFRHRYSRLTLESRITANCIEKLIEFWRTFNEARRQSVASMSVSHEMLLGFLQNLMDECCQSPLERSLVAYEIARVSSSVSDTENWTLPKTNIFLTFYSNFLQFYCSSFPENASGEGTDEEHSRSKLPQSPAAPLFDKYFEQSVSLSAGRKGSGNRLLHCHYDAVEQSQSQLDKSLPTLASSEVGQLAFRVLLDDLLEHGYIADALLLNKIVGNRSNDLLIVKQCTDLVWGRLGLAELPPPYSACATVAQALERMASDCQSMRTHIERLRLYFSISVECNLPYEQAETLPALALCEHLLRKATYTALDLIGKLIKSGDLLAPDDYAVLVCQHVLRYWTTDFDALSTASSNRPVGLDDMANRLFQLCPDQTVLGNQLVQGVTQLLNGPGKGFHELSAACDILVHAHNAFAFTNNVEGIAATLHLARTLSKELENSSSDSHLQLLVKMMHNIGRYGEMSYVLDILYRSGKLPLVFQLRPRPDCEAQFRTSLLEFLRGVSSNQSSQSDLYRHVCLQYGMEREVAQLLFDSATQDVAELGRKAHTVDLNTWASDAAGGLPLAAQKFVDAAKGFARAECPNMADLCIKQARLLALQLRFLSEGNVSVASAAAAAQQQQNQSQGVITAGGTARQPNLLIIVGRTNPDLIREIIISQTVAFECSIISDAYKMDCWSEAVFRQVVLLPKNSQYFHDLMAFYSLTDRFFEELVDLAERYNNQQQQQGNTGLTAQQAARLKRMLHYCPDWTVQYKLAARMGFSDVQHELINSQATPIIKDLIASNQLAPPSNSKQASSSS